MPTSRIPNPSLQLKCQMFANLIKNSKLELLPINEITFKGRTQSPSCIDYIAVTELINFDMMHTGTITNEIIESDHIHIATRIKANFEVQEIKCKPRYRVNLLNNPHKRQEYQKKVAQLAAEFEITNNPLENYNRLTNILKIAAKEILGIIEPNRKENITMTSRQKRY